MEEIIVAMLYLYPGALVDVFSRYLFKYSYREDGTSESAHIARYFVCSVLITVLSIFTFAFFRGKSVANLADITAALTGMIELAWYVVISLGWTLVVTLLINEAKTCLLRLRSRRMEKQEHVQIRNAADTWHEVAYGEETKSIRNHAILRINAGGKEQVGFVKYWPKDLKDGILLTQSNIVAAYFEYDAEQESEDDKFIGSPWYMLFDVESGSFIEVFNGKKLSKYLGFEK